MSGQRPTLAEATARLDALLMAYGCTCGGDYAAAAHHARVAGLEWKTGDLQHETKRAIRSMLQGAYARAELAENEALAAVAEHVANSCNEDDGLVDSLAIRSNAEAMLRLVDAGWMTLEGEPVGRRVLARWVDEDARPVPEGSVEP